MFTMLRALRFRHPISRSIRQAAWLAPYVVVWGAAIVVLRAGALSTDCTTMCLVARGWLWYTVFYATLSLSAFVGAIEALIWMLRVGSVVKAGSASGAREPSHLAH